METRISKARLQERLARLLVRCQQREVAVLEEGHWTPQCIESWNEDRVRYAIRGLEARTVLQFRKWLGTPHYAIDQVILNCLDY